MVINKNYNKEFYNSDISLNIFKRIGYKSVFIEEKIVNKVLKNKTGSIFVGGCGIGREVFVLSKYKFKIFGYDYSLKLLKYAQESFKKTGEKVSFVCGDLKKIAYKDNSFDFATLLHGVLNIIPYSDDRIKILNEIYRILNKNSLLILSVAMCIKHRRIIERIFCFFDLRKGYRVNFKFIFLNLINDLVNIVKDMNREFKLFFDKNYYGPLPGDRFEMEFKHEYTSLKEIVNEIKSSNFKIKNIYRGGKLKGVFEFLNFYLGEVYYFILKK